MSLAADTAIMQSTRQPQALRKSSLFLAAAILVVLFNMYLVWSFALGTWPYQEDGLIEWLTFFALLISAALAFWSIRGHRAKLVRIAIGLALLVLAGEEISWGQRLLELQTPEQLRAINVQSELNFHNIDGIHQHIRLIGIFMLGFAFVVLPWICHRFRGVEDLVHRINLPFLDRQGVAVLGIAVLLMAGPRAIDASTQFDELGEFLVSWAFVLYGLTMVQFEAPQDKRS